MSDQQEFPEDPSEYADPENATQHSTGKGLALPGQNLPDKVYIIPIHNRPFFPAQVLPVIVNEEPWAETLELVSKSPHHSLALFFVDTPPDDPRHFDTKSLPEYGTLVKVHHASRENGKLQFVAQGLTRVRIRGWLSRRGPYLAEVEYPQAPNDPRDEVKAYGMALINAIKELLPLNPLYSEELKNYLNRFSPNDPSPLTDFAAALTSATGPELQEVLDCVPMLKRMEKVLPMLRKEVEVARLQKELSAEVNRKIGEHQREFFLKEQLKVIQQELGLTKDDRSADSDEFRARLAGKTLPAQVQKRLDEELGKLAILETGATMTAVEIDPPVAERLPKTIAEFMPDAVDRFRVVNRDALTVNPENLPDFKDDDSFTLVANLPYNVATPILLTLLERFDNLGTFLVMVQKEVADRLSEKPGSKIYGTPSVKLAWYGTAERVGTIGRNVFWPAPNVDSALVKFTRYQADAPAAPGTANSTDDGTQRELVFRLIDAAFGQRRKTLHAALKTIAPSEAFSIAGIDPTRRGETLTIAEFTALAKAIESCGDGDEAQ